MKRFFSLASRQALCMGAVQSRSLYSLTPLVRQEAAVKDSAALRQHIQHVRQQSKELQAVARYTHSFAEVEGRRPRILLCTFERCASGRPDDQFAIVLADIGFDVDIGPPHQSPDQIARQAVEADVHGIHVSVVDEAGAAPLPELLKSLKANDAADIFVTAGAAIPAEKIPHGVTYVPRGDFPHAAETIVKLLQSTSSAPSP